MLEESAIRLSVEEQNQVFSVVILRIFNWFFSMVICFLSLRKHFVNPRTSQIVEGLRTKFPGIDVEVLMETLLRCGYVDVLMSQLFICQII